ncbi:MAG: formylglycine-generating enzyme family protein [Myxococcota bacterium]|nr:formylglycine-generating enzyme family protein [Myxococcota bacterium]
MKNHSLRAVVTAGVLVCFPGCSSTPAGSTPVAGPGDGASGLDASMAGVTPNPSGTGTVPPPDGQSATTPAAPDADHASPGDDSSLPAPDASMSPGLPEASALDDGATPVTQGDSGTAVSPGTCATGMVRIPAKNQSFMMGFDPAEAPGTIWACYLGKHQVTFTHDYCMDANLVTQGDFSKVMGFNPSKHKTADLTLPVDSETWYDAVLYCNKKSQADGLQPAYTLGAITMNGPSASNIASVAVDITKNGYRLPTNAEYEYAERANTTGLYFFSPTRTPDITTLGAVYAWYSVNSGGVTQPVGKLKPNPWGLYDIVGNLFEWEHDWEGPYATTPEVDPLGPATGTGCGSFGLGIQKMAKGGSWHTDVATHMRISYHFKWAPSATHAELGFRCVSTATK